MPPFGPATRSGWRSFAENAGGVFDTFTPDPVSDLPVEGRDSLFGTGNSSQTFPGKDDELGASMMRIVFKRDHAALGKEIDNALHSLPGQAHVASDGRGG